MDVSRREVDAVLSTFTGVDTAMVASSSRIRDLTFQICDDACMQHHCRQRPKPEVLGDAVFMKLKPIEIA